MGMGGSWTPDCFPSESRSPIYFFPLDDGLEPGALEKPGFFGPEALEPRFFALKPFETPRRDVPQIHENLMSRN